MYPQMYGTQQLTRPPRGRALVTETHHVVLVRNGVATRVFPRDGTGCDGAGIGSGTNLSLLRSSSSRARRSSPPTA